MPRKPDPNLERIIIEAALRLLDQGGLQAVTMRAVAERSRTTTPTLYERFRDREALLHALTDFHRDTLAATLSQEDTLEDTGRKFLAYCRKHENAIELLIQRMTENLKAKRHGPIYVQVRNSLIQINGFTPKEAEEITIASTSLIAGTALLTDRLGCGTPAAKKVENATLEALRRLASTNGNNRNGKRQ